MTLKVAILAAGQGTRMRSRLPKVLHTIANKPLLQWVLQAAQGLQPEETFVIYGYQGEQVKTAFAGQKVTWVAQTEQLGTGHALQQVLPLLKDKSQVLVLLGDTPLISTTTLQRLLTSTDKDEVGLVTALVEEPTGLGRILRNKNDAVVGIVEEKDATADEKLIDEINTGIMLFPAKKLKAWLAQLKNNNTQNEYYLTDVIALAVADSINIKTVQPEFNEEIIGVNDRTQLAELESIYQAQAAEFLMQQGVTLRDPSRFDLRGELKAEQDVTIDINVIIEGKVTIGRDTNIGANVQLKNVVIGEGVTILPNCILEDSIVGNACIIGPFARLRPGTELADYVKIGNFVETKKTIVDSYSKLPHHAYVGDAEIGKNVNIGAGVITCNYDGVDKHKTIIGDNAFIGTDSQLIAPVKIGKGAYIAAGSSINKDAPADKLTVARAKQKTIENWQRPKKKKD